MNRKVRLVDADDLITDLILLDDAEPRSDAQRALILTLIGEINAAPKLEYEPQREGHWETMRGLDGVYFCSACKSAQISQKSRYCPDCGAKMDGGAAGNEN